MRITPELNKQRKQGDGTHAVRLIIAAANTRTTIGMGFSILPRYWDDERGRVKISHTRAAEYNNAIAQAIRLAEDHLLKYPRATAKELRDAMQRGPVSANLVKALEQVAKEHTEKFSEGTIASIGTLLNDLRVCVPNVALGDVDARTVAHIHRYLLTKDKRNGGKLHQNSIRHRMRRARDLINIALHDRGLPKTTAFLKAIPKQLPTRERLLTAEELDRLIAFDMPIKQLMLAKHTFLLQVFLGGMRISDLILLTPDCIRKRGGRWELDYDMKKTGEPAWIPLPQQAVDIIQHYQGGGHVLPLFTGSARNQVGGATARINRSLKVVAQLCGIAPGLSSHYARGSFGDWARREKRDMKTLQMIFRHKSITTTMVYMARFDKDSVGETFAQLAKSMPKRVL